MKTLKRTYNLSPDAVTRLETLARDTGLKFSDILDRLLLGKPVGGFARLEDKLVAGELRK